MANVLITGTSTGIGLATAVTLARAGHTVFATMRNPEGSKELAEIAAAKNLPLKILALDVDDDDSVTGAVEQVLSESGQIDVLVNNAGVGGAGAVEELPLAAFRQAMETNYFGAIRCIQAVLPGMRERREGCIVNVSSVAGRVAIAPQAAYSASKFALEALSECLAQEMKAFNIRVAIIEPGVIATPIFTKGRPAPEDSPYPHLRRLRKFFEVSLQNPVSPNIVGQQILEIIVGDSWKLRYLVGPDSQIFIQSRENTSDEEWISQGAASDEEWADYIKRTFGLNVQI